MLDLFMDLFSHFQIGLFRPQTPYFAQIKSDPCFSPILTKVIMPSISNSFIYNRAIWMIDHLISIGFYLHPCMGVGTFWE